MYAPNPKLDLVLERLIDLPKEVIWRMWTEPELLKQWFTPAPWSTAECVIDLRPGGLFGVTMRSPDGEEFKGDGCYLEIVENERLVWTSALLPGYRPQINTIPGKECDAIPFTAVITMETVPEGTLYRATLLHPDEETCKKHDNMGFQDGWGKALDQLVEVARGLG